MNHEKERIKILVVSSLSHVQNRLTVLRQYYYSIVITTTVLRAPILKKTSPIRTTEGDDRNGGKGKKKEG